VIEELRDFSEISPSALLGLTDVSEMVSGSTEFGTYDELKSSSKARILTLEKKWHRLLEGDGAGRKGLRTKDEDVHDGFFNDEPCVFRTCTTLQLLVADIVRTLDYLSTGPGGDVAFSDDSFASIVSLIVFQLYDRTFRAYLLLVNYYDDRVDLYSSVADSMFGLSFVLIPVVFVLLFMHARQNATKETRRMRQLFLHLPLETIENAPLVHEFMKGNIVRGEMLNEIVVESEKRTQWILETASDGFLQIDGDGIVETCNQASVDLFGLHTRDEIINHLISEFIEGIEVDVLPFLSSAMSIGKGDIVETVQKKWTLTGKGRDGERFPLSFSLSVTMIGNVPVCSSFVQDIREDVRRQELVRKERSTSQQLLLNIMPASISARLQQQELPISDQHPHATVLFADIVSFTPLSHKLGPIKIVELLHKMFSAFDERAESRHITKIKTIGDCYMA
jgi:PAS domain S-box-containing protein